MPVMRPRPPAPGRSLAELFPDVAATWDSEANSELTPADVGAGASVAVHWRCPAGHVWTESVAQRTSMGQWKHGYPAACRLCTGYLVESVYRCGHTAVEKAVFANPAKPCPDCRRASRAEWQASSDARRAAYHANKEEIKRRLRPQAEQQAAEFWRQYELDRIPDVLQTGARRELIGALMSNLVGEQCFGSPAPQKLEQCLPQLRELAQGVVHFVPGRPLELFGQAWWPPAFAPPCSPAPHEPETLAELANVCADAIALRFPHDPWLEVDARTVQAYGDPSETRTITTLIGEALHSWAFLRGWRTYRELHVPLGDDREHGRLDLVILREKLPDVVIEIDSSSADRSDMKLALARERGALPVWIRWRGGQTRSIDGVHVVDLTAA